MASLIIPSTPVPWARSRSSGKRHFTAKKQAEWREVIQYEASSWWGKEPSVMPIMLKVEFRFEPPASWPAWKRAAALDGLILHTSKPDTDNLIKMVKDALTGIVWVDDAQVFREEAEKRYAIGQGFTLINAVPVRISPASISRKSDLIEVTI